MAQTTYFIVTQHPEGFMVEALTEHSQQPKICAGPRKTAKDAWDLARKLATSAAHPGPAPFAHYGTLPEELCRVVDPDNPGPRACWVAPA